MRAPKAAATIILPFALLALWLAMAANAAPRHWITTGPYAGLVNTVLASPQYTWDRTILAGTGNSELGIVFGRNLGGSLGI